MKGLESHAENSGLHPTAVGTPGSDVTVVMVLGMANFYCQCSMWQGELGLEKLGQIPSAYHSPLLDQQLPFLWATPSLVLLIIRRQTLQDT